MAFLTLFKILTVFKKFKLFSNKCEHEGQTCWCLTMSAEGHHLWMTLSVMVPTVMMQWEHEMCLFKDHFFHFIKWKWKAMPTLSLHMPPKGLMHWSPFLILWWEKHNKFENLVCLIFSDNINYVLHHIFPLPLNIKFDPVFLDR